MRIIPIATLIFSPALLNAQAAPGGIVSGVAMDSLRGGALSGALISVEGTGLNAITNARGEFRIPGIPAGHYSLDIAHPLLDTLRVRLRTPHRLTTGSDSSFVVISTPSPATLVNIKCGVDEPGASPAMALGFVTEAGTDQPAEGAEVIVQWTDYTIEGTAINRSERDRSGLVGSDGSYRVCGVPSDLVTGIFATRGSDTTATITVSFHPRIAFVSFQLSRGDPAAGAGLTGRVADSAGRPVAGARVSAENERVAGITREDGSFDLTGLRPGTRAVMVRRIGFLPVSVPVNVKTGDVQRVDIRLTTYVPVLETVRIRARRELSLEQVGFRSRKQSANGRFFSPEDIERRRPYWLNDLLVMSPSLRTYRASGGSQVVTGRGGQCVRYFVDGHLWPDMFVGPNEFISGHELGAVEVYSGFSAPAQFTARSRDGSTCASVVIWTRWKLRI